ncbi:MAG: Atxe2 family lasso peptide isopeptidase [Woeseia sp.]
MRYLKLLAAVGAAGAVLSCDAQSQRAGLEIQDAIDESPRYVTPTDLIELREIGDMRGGGLSMSPDGSHVAFMMRRANVAANDYQAAWFVTSTDRANVPVRVGDGGDPTLFKYFQPGGRPNGAWISDYAKWSPDGRGIAYRKRVGDETQIWWSTLDGRETKQLSHNAADVEAFYWSDDGSRIYFETDVDRAALERVNESRFRNGHIYNYDKEWSTIDGRPYYPRYHLADGTSRVWILDVASRDEHLATDDEQPEYERLRLGASMPEIAPKARKIAWIEGKHGAAWVQPDDPDKQGMNPPLTVYATIPGEAEKPTRCSADACTGLLELSKFLRHGLHWDSVSDEVYFVRKEGMGYSKHSLYGWNVGEDRVRKIFTTHEWISDCSIAHGRAICFRETPTYPRTVVAIDLRDAEIQTLFDPNPEFRNVVLGDVELFEWENDLGYGTFGFLVKPPDYVPGRRYPLAFVGYRAQHALRGGVGDEYPVHVLAANGFVVLVYDKPTPYDAQQVHSNPLDIGRARWGPDLFDVRMPLASFKTAIQMLDEEGLIDPDRVALTGLSAGVSHVNYSLIHSDLFVTAIASSANLGPNNGVLAGVSAEFRKYRRAIGAGRYPGPHGFLPPHVSLQLNAERIDEPLLVNVSDTEHTWALEEIAALSRHGKPVEMVVYPDEGHVKWHPAHRFSVYERNIDWLNFWLQDLEDSSPAKADQYARWRRMREQHMPN